MIVWGLVIDPRASRDGEHITGQDAPSKTIENEPGPELSASTSRMEAAYRSGSVWRDLVVTRMQQRNIAQMMQARVQLFKDSMGSEQILLRSRTLTPDIPSSQLPAARNMALAPRIGQRHTP